MFIENVRNIRSGKSCLCLTRKETLFLSIKSFMLHKLVVLHKFVHTCTFTLILTSLKRPPQPNGNGHLFTTVTTTKRLVQTAKTGDLRFEHETEYENVFSVVVCRLPFIASFTRALALPKTRTESEGSGNVTGVKFENRTLSQMSYSLIASAQRPVKEKHFFFKNFKFSFFFIILSN